MNGLQVRLDQAFPLERRWLCQQLLVDCAASSPRQLPCTLQGAGASCQVSVLWGEQAARLIQPLENEACASEVDSMGTLTQALCAMGCVGLRAGTKQQVCWKAPPEGSIHPAEHGQDEAGSLAAAIVSLQAGKQNIFS